MDCSRSLGPSTCQGCATNNDQISIALSWLTGLARKAGVGLRLLTRSLGTTSASCSFLIARSMLCSAFTNPSTSPTSTRQYLLDGSAAAGQEVNVGVLAADEQDSFSRLDAGVNFRRQHIADEGIPQRDQVHIRSEEKSRKILQRNEARSVNGHATRAKLAFDAIGLCSRGIQPEPKAMLRLRESIRRTLR